MTPWPDQKERDRIAAELDRNLLVEAPAGSGKTHSMSSRMVAGIEKGLYRVEEMAGVTFTRKAASELRGRLQLALEEALAARPSERLEAALRNLDRLFLGTVHSFCGRLVREHPVEAGVSPGFRETDEAEDESLRRHIFRRCLEYPEGMQLTRELADSGARPADLLGALAVVCDNGEVDFPVPDLARPVLDPIWPEVGVFADKLSGFLPARIDRATTCATQDRARQFLRHWRSGGRKLFNLVKQLLLWEREPGFVLKWWAESRAEQYALRDQVLPLVNDFRGSIVLPFLEHWRGYLYALSMQFLLRVRQRYAEERRRRGLLNFNDLLTTAAELLRSSASALARLQARYRFLFVDEFQDTDPIQAEVLFWLAARSEQDEKDWTRLKLRPGALFIVGDPKQSIYRFRRADMETYNLVRQRMDDTVTLSASFRSFPGLCEWTNRVFSQLLPAEPTERQAAFSPLQAVKTGEATLWRNLESCQRYSDAASCEAPRIADWIAGAVAAGTHRWGDFLILAFKREDLSLYARALEQRGIPCEVTGGHARSGDLVETLFELLAVLGDPLNQVGVVGVLRGCLFGIDDDTLFRHRQGGGTFSLAPGEGEEVVQNALAALGGWRDLVRRIPFGASVEKVLEESGMLALAAATPGCAAELLQIADQVRVQCQEGLTLSEAMRNLRLERSGQPLALDCGRSNVVRVMNLHQAKGLEARVVFLASPTGGFPARADRRIIRTEGRARGFLSIGNQYQTFAQPPDWPHHEAIEVAFLEEERVRLLYVAATRARETLIVSQWAGSHGGARRPWEPFEPFLADAPELPPALPAFPPEEAPALDPRPDWESRRASARQPSWSRSSVTATNDREGLRVWSAPVPEAVLASERPDSGALWGELIHRLLEQLMLRPDLTDDQLERLARWYTFDQPELSELVPLALQTVANVRQSEFWQRAMQAGQRLVEVPFGVKVGDRLLFGVLDLALLQEEGWEVVDYKTDRRSLEELVERYAGQVSQYAEHWAALAAEPVRYAGIYGVREGRLSPDLGRMD